MSVSSPNDQDPGFTGGVTDADESSSPRAFAVGAGLLFQAVGSVMFLGSCCLWSISGQWLPAADEVPASWLEYLRGEHCASAMVGIDMLITVVGGMGMVGAGIGLYGERRRSGALATALVIGLAVLYFASAIVLLFVRSWGMALTAAGFGLVMALMAPLGIHSAGVLRRFPPPVDQNVVTPEFRERYLRERAERRKKYDL